MTLAVSAGIAVALAGGGWLARWLTTPAAALAAAIGTVVVLGAGLPGLVLLGTFFCSGSLLSTGSREGTRRRFVQVLANGWTAGVGGCLVLVHPPIGWSVLVGGLAAAQSDTWATELGRRWGGTPVLITSRHPVAPGVSGGVTWAGTLGGVAGAAVMGLLAWALGQSPTLALWATAAGTTGMLADSLLGATFQARYRCDGCAADTETPYHCEHRNTTLVGGLRWMTNDTVNGLGSGLGASCMLLRLLP